MIKRNQTFEAILNTKLTEVIRDSIDKEINILCSAAKTGQD